MPGREDFGIVRTRFFLDDRAHAASAAYVERGLAVQATALATVAGHIAMLGAFAARETDDGVLNAFAINAALMTSPDVSEKVIDALQTAGLLRAKRGEKWYLAGFKDGYERILSRRSSDAARKREERRNARSSLKTSAGRPQDIPKTSDRTSADSGPIRSDPVRSTPPPPSDGGESPVGVEGNGKALRPRQREKYETVLKFVRIHGNDHPSSPECYRRDIAAQRLDRLHAGLTTDDEIREQLPDYQRWVTDEKLARRTGA